MRVEETVVYAKKQSQLLEVWLRLKESKTAMLGLAILLVFVFLAIFADVLFDYETTALATDYSLSLAGPSWEHPFGTDFYGRDILARIVHGTRYSFTFAMIAVILSTVIGTIIGSLCGYFGGAFDTVVMRIMDTISAIPGILLILTLVSALGTGLMNLVIAIVVTAIPDATRVTRSAVLSLSGSEYIKAAIACGTKTPRIIWKHIIPNAIGPIIVSATMNLGSNILSIASMSYLGMGIQPPTPEWGSMLSEGQEFIQEAVHVVVFPGLAILLAALGFNLLGDGIRDAVDPRLRK